MDDVEETPLEVLVDGQIFLMHARGGISRYFAELLREFGEHPEWGINAQTSVWRSPNQHLRQVDPTVADIPFDEGSIAWKIVKRLAPYPSRRTEGRLHPDVVHFTYYDPARLGIFPGVPKVVTVHDMAPEMLPSLGNEHLAKRAYVDQADAIVCVSAKTRDDLFAVWGEIRDRPVIVTGHATSERFNPSVAPAEMGFPYLLHVGGRDDYKNFPTLMRAFAGSRAQATGVRLLAVGGGAFTAMERDLADRLRIADALVQLTADEADLPGLYRGALAFVFPSTFEGFGIPVLEAMSVGAPAILADTPVFHEVAADAARYVPPRDSAALRAAIDDLTDEPADRLRLRTAGLTRAQDFSWERTAKATATLYRAIALDAGTR